MSATIPPPLGLGRPSQRNKRYRLVMVQNPIRARCCGFGEKDRRPVDPPPILQLFIEQSNGELKNAIDDEDNASLFVVQCSLYSEDGKEQRSNVYNPSSLHGSYSGNNPIPSTGTLVSFQEPTSTRSLMGTIISNAYQLSNDQNLMGIFFVFPDLSVRVEGRFRLRFAFMNLSVGDPLTMSAQISTEAISDPFTVYSAKNFPGMTDSTGISQAFAHQGIKISIRKDRRVRPITPTDQSHPDPPSPIPEGNSDQIPPLNSNDTGGRRPYRRIDISSFLLP